MDEILGTHSCLVQPSFQGSVVSSLQVSGCLSCQCGISFEMLLPHLAAVIVEEAEISGDCVWLWARARTDGASCPRCGRSSGKVHSTYQRRLADARDRRAPGADPAAGAPVLLRRTRTAPRVTFAEQVERPDLPAVPADPAAGPRR